jgi:hypothetical protein
MFLLSYSCLLPQLLQLLHFCLDFLLHYTFFCQIALYVMLTHGRGPRALCENEIRRLWLQKLFTPVPVQMPMLHKPVFKILQFSTHLAPLFCIAPGLSSLLLGVHAVHGPSHHKPHHPLFSPWARRSPTVEPTAACRLLRGRLTERAFTGLGTTSLSRPIRAKAPADTLCEVSVYHAKISTSHGVLLYPILGGLARHRWLSSWTTTANSM